MDVLVDTNVLIDYAESQPAAVDFFRRVKAHGIDIYVLTDVLFEARYNSPDFHKIQKLFAELIQYQFFHKVRSTEEEKRLAGSWRNVTDSYGAPLDYTDRLIIAVGKTRNYCVYSFDLALKKLAAAQGVRLL